MGRKSKKTVSLRRRISAGEAPPTFGPPGPPAKVAGTHRGVRAWWQQWLAGARQPWGSFHTSPAVCLLLLLAVLAVFGRTIGYDFVNFDDNQYVYDNTKVLQGLTGEAVGWAFTHSYADNWHPLTWLSHMTDCQLYGLRPWGHHLTNVLLHAATAIVLFLVLKRMTGALWPSALVAAVFAIHPLRVESVAWISERKDVLSGLFFVLTLGAYVRYAERPFSLARYLSVVLLFALGLMSKPMLVTLPFVLLLLDYWPLKRLGPAVAEHRDDGTGKLRGGRGVAARLVVEKIPLLLLSAASCAATLAAQRDAMKVIENLSLPSRIANALVATVAYLGQIFYPAGLSALYPYPDGGLPTWKVIGAIVVLLGISAVALASWRRRPYLVVGWLWYLGMLVPVIGLIQVGAQSMADRYTYLTQIGLYVAMAWALADICSSWHYRRVIGSIAAGAIVVALMACAWQQTRYWRDTETLWLRVLDCDERNAIAHHNLGIDLYRQERFAEATAHFRRALEIDPRHVGAHVSLGNALGREGKLAEAIEQFQTALKIDPDYAVAHNNLGVAYAQQGNVEQAIAHITKARDLAPDYAEPRNSLGLVLERQGQLDSAMALYAEAAKLKPTFAEPYYNLGLAFAHKGKFDLAAGYLRKALEIKPDYVQAHASLGNICYQQGNRRDAIAQWREATRWQPDDVTTLKQAAWVLATSPDASLRNGSEAVALARRAVELSGGRDAECLAALAAAQAESGHFSEAAQRAEQALRLATEQGNTPLIEAYVGQLAIYQAGHPIRDLRPQPAGNAPTR